MERLHLEAALAVWRYCEASAKHIFGDSIGDPLADDLLTALRTRPDGLSRNDIHNHFSRHKSASQIGQALR